MGVRLRETFFEQACWMRNEMESQAVPLPTGGAIQNRELFRFAHIRVTCLFFFLELRTRAIGTLPSSKLS
jgi:hypothetical protein